MLLIRRSSIRLGIGAQSTKSMSPIASPVGRIYLTYCAGAFVSRDRWIVGGRWATYQVSDYLHTVFMGQAKTAATVAEAASSATETVPAACCMGWLSFTTQVSLLALHPWLIPAIIGYGFASIGVPMYILT